MNSTLNPRALRTLMLSAGLALTALTLTGCPEEGVICAEGLTRCNNTCEDVQNDPVNCGACNVACQAGQVCSEGACVCVPGATNCGGACVITASDPRNCGACGMTCSDMLAGSVCIGGECDCSSTATKCPGGCANTDTDPSNCGACGNACGMGEVCESGACVSGCSMAFTQCGQSCVDVQTDESHCGMCGNACMLGQFGECVSGQCQCATGYTVCSNTCVDPLTDSANCGACGNACPQGQTCHAGVCSYDVVLACFTNGQVRGMQVPGFVQGTLEPLGAGPQALDLYGKDVLLSLDGADAKLYQARLSTLEQLSSEATVGAIPNDLLVDGQYVYVINSGTNSLAVFQGGAADDSGVPLTLVDELAFGDNTYPQVMVKVGSKLYVTLYGGTTAATAGAGQKVVEVDIADPANLMTGQTWELTTLPLGAFADGGTTLPRPQGITERNQTLYVALNNFDEFYSVAGPAYLATLPLDGGAAGLIELPADKCLNAVWTQTVGDHVLVSCAGQSDYSMFPIVTTTETGVALIGANDQVLSSVEFSCPAGGDGGCASPSAGRFSVKGSTVLVADQSAGRLFALELANDQLTESRTYSTAEGPLNVCPVSPMTGYSNVGDVLVVP